MAEINAALEWNNESQGQTTSVLEELQQVIEKMIRNPEGEAEYFASSE